ncbi:MAG: 16S rRNA (cytosine(967)-C(5))-methyltransferase RsmB [Desulfobacteraceae bacterium]|nr:16S rRNA (cytosine(967)-C(5))-methyltransferase RsmB [Desulfobacteraceae bacterium]
MPTVRAIAIELLSQWEETGEPLDSLLEPAAVGLADLRDRQLLYALGYGAARWQGYLDWVIGRFSSHPLSKMKPRTRAALRLGILQLLVLSRIPAAAAINETVAALAAARQPKWLTGFVNGLLRNVARQAHELPTPWRQAEELPLSARLSHPDWLLTRWQARYGLEKTIAIAAANNAPPPLCLRVNTARVAIPDFLEACRAKGLEAEPGGLAPAAERLPGYSGSVAGIPGYAEGWFMVQDEAAQLVPLLAGPFAAGSYLDACAGLGGKTIQLAALLPADGPLVAVEPSLKRLEQLRENLVRLGLNDRVEVRPGELGGLTGGTERYRAILVDAPCSGLGVIRRHPDIRWNRRSEDLGRFQRKQLELLTEAATLLKPGGVLVYATCSIEPEENDQVVARFLASHPGFRLTDAREFLPPAAGVCVDQEGFLRTLPGEHGLDGFFAARLIRNEE